MENKIQKADKAYRKNLFLAYLLIIFLAMIFIKFVVPPILATLDAMAVTKSVPLIEAILIVFIILFIVPSLYLISVGKKIIFHKSLPYPGMKVIRDTKILMGKKAIFRGRALVIFGEFAIITAIIGAIMTHIAFTRFKNDPIFSPIFKKPPVTNNQTRI